MLMKVRIFRKCLNFTPMNDTTVRPFIYLQVVKKSDLRCYLVLRADLMPFGATTAGGSNGRNSLMRV